jgi:hypothetical protein
MIMIRLCAWLAVRRTRRRHLPRVPTDIIVELEFLLRPFVIIIGRGEGRSVRSRRALGHAPGGVGGCPGAGMWRGRTGAGTRIRAAVIDSFVRRRGGFTQQLAHHAALLLLTLALGIKISQGMPRGRPRRRRQAPRRRKEKPGQGGRGNNGCPSGGAGREGGMRRGIARDQRNIEWRLLGKGSAVQLAERAQLSTALGTGRRLRVPSQRRCPR